MQLYEVLQTDKSSCKPPLHSQGYCQHGTWGKWAIWLSTRSIKMSTPLCKTSTQFKAWYTQSHQDIVQKYSKKNYTAQNSTLQCLELEFISILFPLPVCRKYLFQLDQYCVKGIKMSYYIWTHNCYWIMPKIFGIANYCFKAGCWTKGHFGSRKFHLLHIGTQILSSPMLRQALSMSALKAGSDPIMFFSFLFNFPRFFFCLLLSWWPSPQLFLQVKCSSA